VVKACTTINRIIGAQTAVGQQPRRHAGVALQHAAATHETAVRPVLLPR